jgi:hypothetical protein
MLLATKNQSLQIDLAGAVSANELPWSVEYVDRSIDSKIEKPGAVRGVTAGATDTTMLAAPANKWGSGFVRDIKNIQIYNKDTAAATVTVQILDGSTVCELFKATLQTTETLVYNEGSGWQVISSAGAQKTDAALVGATLALNKTLVGGANNVAAAAGLIRSKVCHFTAAEVIAMNATPLVLLDYSAMLAAGECAANDTFIFHGAILQLDGGAAAYDTNENTTVEYQTAGGGATASLTLANFFNAGADNKMSTLKPLATDIAPEAAQDLVLLASASPYTAAGSRELNVEIFYSVYSRV